MMSDHINIYWQFLHDSDALLDGMPLDMMAAAMAGEPPGTDPFLLALDADDIDDEIRTYASGGDMSSLTLKQRWCLAARMKLAAGVLYPFRHERDGKGNAFLKALARKPRARLIEFLLIDMAPSILNIVNDYIVFGEEWCAPMRPPWHQSLLRRRNTDKIKQEARR